MADRYTQSVGKLPVVPYREPEPWVPSGGFGQFRTPEEQQRDAELAAQHEAENDEAGEPDAEG
jgi:hypothetical protein